MDRSRPAYGSPLGVSPRPELEAASLPAQHVSISYQIWRGRA